MNTVKPFLTNKGFLTNENITIKHKDKIVTDNSKLAHLFKDMFFLTEQKEIMKKSKNHKNVNNFCKIRNLTKKFQPDEVYNNTYGPTLSNMIIRSMV